MTQHKFTHTFSSTISDTSTSATKELSFLNSSELKQERDRLLIAEKCTPTDLDRLVAIEELLEQRGDNMNASKLKPWHYILGGVAACFLGTNMLGIGKVPTYQQAQPTITPNTVSVPSGSGATVFNFDND